VAIIPRLRARLGKGERRRRAELGKAALDRAQECWSKDVIIERAPARMAALA
jgi:hypothetical protein